LSQLTYLLDKMKNTLDAGVPLLDKSVVVWGSSMGDPNLHNHRRCPLIFAGKANGGLEGDIHIRAPQGTPMSNAFVSLMQAIGHDDFQALGDSTGELALRPPRGAASTEAGV
jgi:hypothetical protein